jgi:hypothetical protein
MSIGGRTDPWASVGRLARAVAGSVFVVKMDGDANEHWRYQFGHGGAPDVDFLTWNRNLAVDEFGHAVVVGSTRGVPGENNDWLDGFFSFFVWLDDDGSERERGEYGTLADDFGRAGTFTHDGYMVVVGTTEGHLAPDDPDEDGTNAFVLRLRP